MLQEFLTFAELALMYIRATRKGAATAANHRDLRLGIEVEAAQRIRKMPHENVVERVQLLGSVQRQSCDLIATEIFDHTGRRICLRHSRRLSRSSSRYQQLL